LNSEKIHNDSIRALQVYYIVFGRLSLKERELRA